MEVHEKVKIQMDMAYDTEIDGYKLGIDGAWIKNAFLKQLVMKI